MVRLSATEVARNFSAVVNRVDAGEDVEIVRNGVAIAQLRRPAPPRTLSAAAWREAVASAPAVDEDYASELEEARERIGPPVSAWPS